MSHKGERKVAVLHSFCSLDGCIDRRCHHHHHPDTFSFSCHFHHHGRRRRRSVDDVRQSSTDLFTFSLLFLVILTLVIPSVDGKKKKEDKKCMPEIVAIKKVKIVPVAVPIKSMSGSTMTTYTEEIMTDGKMPMKMKSAPPTMPPKQSKPPKYDAGEEEEMNKPQVMQVPVYNTDSGGEEEEEEGGEEEEEEHEEQASPYDSAMAEQVDGGDAYSTAGGGDDDDAGGYKRRRDEKIMSTRNNQSTLLRHKRHTHPTLISISVKSNNNNVGRQTKLTSSPRTIKKTTNVGDIETLFSQRLMAIMSKRDESNLAAAAAVSSLYSSPIPLASPIDSMFSPSEHLQSSLLNRLRNMSKGHEMHHRLHY